MTKPISDKIIRAEEYQSAFYNLSNYLDEIRMTVSEREIIKSFLMQMENIFLKANE